MLGGGGHGISILEGIKDLEESTLEMVTQVKVKTHLWPIPRPLSTLTELRKGQGEGPKFNPQHSKI